ncbi:MAG: glycine zipper 2TM domain-containing protein [Candidatus Omnitrophica bacterium]|nr:glycine zipper 2TM domain-containing protein [Candidatus Omnitrophota bacterium]
MKIAIGAVVGGLIGLGIGYFGKCASGVCPLTGNPVISTVLGALIGAMLMMK